MTPSKASKQKRSDADKKVLSAKPANRRKRAGATPTTASRKKSAQKKAASKPSKTAPLKRESAHARSDAVDASSTLTGFAGQLVDWAEKFSDVAGPFANMAITMAKSQFRDPPKRAAVKAAGALLRQAREALGMTAKEVGKAIDLKDFAMLEQAETGKIALPFEVVLRLAGVLGRHDPVSFALNLTRSYHPALWQGMEALGIGKLAVQVGRERELANIYRRRDAARRLNDKEFAALLALAGAAFDMGLEFRNQR